MTVTQAASAYMRKRAPFGFTKWLPESWCLQFRSPAKTTLLCAPKMAYRSFDRSSVCVGLYAETTSRPRGAESSMELNRGARTRGSAAEARQRGDGEETPSPRWRCHLLRDPTGRPGSTCSWVVGIDEAGSCTCLLYTSNLEDQELFP